MIEPNPYKAPDGTPEPEPDVRPSPFRSAAGIVALVLTFIAGINLIHPVQVMTRDEAAVFCILYGLSVFVTYKAFRIGGIVNLIPAAAAAALHFRIADQLFTDFWF